jgi:hypothetical protein
MPAMATERPRRRAGVYCGVKMRRLLRRQSGGWGRKATGDPVVKSCANMQQGSRNRKGLSNLDVLDCVLSPILFI